jgi:alkylation response protein AidB-like acyl-CoA dehydrogenase
MQYQLTESQKMIRQTIREIVKDKVVPRAAEIDETDEFPWDIFRIFQEADLLGLAVPVEYGGVGADSLTFCLVTEEIAKASLACATIVTTQGLGVAPILLAGSEEQKRRYLPQIAKGECVVAFGLTEPEAGSDVTVIETRAIVDGDSYLLNGSKCFTSQGAVAHIFSIFAKTDMEVSGARGISAFIVDKDTPGFSIGKHERKMGVHGISNTELFFDDCRIPQENLMGKEGQGFGTAMRTLDVTRPTVACQAVGVAQGALDYALNYAKERVQFGQPIIDFQGIQFMLADMAMEIEAARQLAYKAATLIDEGSEEIAKYGAMSKCFASDVAMRVTTNAVQILGGYGYMKSHPVERMMRDAKIIQIWEGTNQIQRIVISRALAKQI